MDALDRKINEVFPGKVVRKDLTALLRRGANVPTFVLEYLLGMYCATDDETAIAEGVEKIREVAARVAKTEIKDKSRVWNTARIEALELDNLIEVAQATLISAEARKESRGAHASDDHQERDDANWMKHTLYYSANQSLTYKPVHTKPLTVDYIEPAKRVY